MRASRGRESPDGPVLRVAVLAAVFCALSGPPGVAEDACPDNLKVDRYPDLSKSVDQSLSRATRLLEEALTSADWDAKIVAARKLLVSAAARSKGCTLPQYHLGVSYYDTMLFDEADRWLKKAIEGNVGFHEAKTALARVKIVTKDLPAALSLSDAALSICASYRPAIETKAQSLILLNRLDDAKTFFERAPLPVKLEGDWKTVGEIKEKLHLTLQGPGWSPKFVAESENYRAFTGVSKAFAEQICRRAEFIHAVYRRIFPEIEKPERRYEIWVYPDLQSYMKAGAPQDTSGYYDRLFRHLVLFGDEESEQTFETLQHEAFHQYLDDYLELAPSWFNEGLGDYFGAYEYLRKDGREHLRSRPSPGRLPAIKAALRSGAYTRLPILMQMSQSQMYSRAQLHYPQAWSLIYFILEGESDRAKFGTSQGRKYMKTLQAYFKLLRSGKNMIQAYQQTFGKLDMKKLEEDWKDCILNLEMPPRQAGS